MVLCMHQAVGRSEGLVPVLCLHPVAGAGADVPVGTRRRVPPGRDGALSVALGHLRISGIDRLEKYIAPR